MKGLVLIGGGTGFVGGALHKALKKVGYRVNIISRRPGPSCISWTELAREGLPSKTVAVVNTAGQNVFDKTRKWTEGFKQELFASRINTTASLARAINKAESKPKVFISMSGVGYYKPSQTAEYDEYSKGGDFDFLSKLASEWESSAELSPESSKVCRSVIVRSGVVLGRHGGMIKDLFWPFYCGVGGPVGSGKQYFPWIHIRDLVGLMMFAIEHQNVKGVLNGVAPHVITNKEFATSFGNALYRPAILPLPVQVLNFLFSPERAKIMTEGQRVLPKRVMEYGFTYDYPTIDSACKEFARISYDGDFQ